MQGHVVAVLHEALLFCAPVKQMTTELKSYRSRCNGLYSAPSFMIAGAKQLRHDSFHFHVENRSSQPYISTFCHQLDKPSRDSL